MQTNEGIKNTVYLKTENGEYIPISSGPVILDSPFEPTEEEKVVAKLGEPMSFECTVENANFNMILLRLLGLITNNKLKMKHLPMIRKSVSERKR